MEEEKNYADPLVVANEMSALVNFHRGVIAGMDQVSALCDLFKRMITAQTAESAELIKFINATQDGCTTVLRYHESEILYLNRMLDAKSSDVTTDVE